MMIQLPVNWGSVFILCSGKGSTLETTGLLLWLVMLWCLSTWWHMTFRQRQRSLSTVGFWVIWPSRGQRGPAGDRGGRTNFFADSRHTKADSRHSLRYANIIMLCIIYCFTWRLISCRWHFDRGGGMWEKTGSSREGVSPDVNHQLSHAPQEFSGRRLANHLCESAGLHPLAAEKPFAFLSQKKTRYY